MSYVDTDPRAPALELTPAELYQAAEAVRYFARDVDDERIAVPSFCDASDPEGQQRELEALADKLESCPVPFRIVAGAPTTDPAGDLANHAAALLARRHDPL